ncbi:hypothetical protein Taro_037472 [Colocasia esculenta]|uniref:Cytochrome P450 n=1 Tax=Colocasia esculenta TaxID=4460 RepID=A0A843WCX7_COLES|nr:hypothetical protein [Colocasia esculenta]
MLSGKLGFAWKGATPWLMVRDPDLVKDIFCMKDNCVQKPPPLNPFVNLLTMGVTALEGQKWIKRRKLIMPAFHIDQLKVSPPAPVTCLPIIFFPFYIEK